MAKQIYSLVSIIFLIILVNCSEKNSVSVRKFPYPYKAALAISSDIDQTSTYQEFAIIQEFLNSENETIFGPGLGLEIGNSFWFYNDSYDNIDNAGDSLQQVDEGISIWKGTSDTLNIYAPKLIELIQSRYIDCLHSYGNFGKESFTRDFARRAVELMKEKSFRTNVYINHGAVKTNFQNIGDASWDLGDNPESDYYHTDITIPAGIKFLWRGQLTHCIGQDADFSVMNMLKQVIEYFQDLKYSEQNFPHDNNLVHLYTLDDSTKLFEFVRYVNPSGHYPEATADNIIHQLGPEQMDNLIDNSGYMIFYTHFGRNSGYPYLSDPTIEALRYIGDKNKSKKLMVTTTSRLLNYYIHQKYLFWHTLDIADTTNIYIDSISNAVEGCFIPDENQLEGLTFYIPDNRVVQLFIDGIATTCIQNDIDNTGRLSITIPWRKLQLPPGVFQLSPDNNTEITN